MGQHNLNETSSTKAERKGVSLQIIPRNHVLVQYQTKRFLFQHCRLKWKCCCGHLQSSSTFLVWWCCFEVTGLRQHAGFIGSCVSHSSSPLVCGYPGHSPRFPNMGKFLRCRLCCWDKLQSFAWLTFLDYLKSFVFKTMLSCRVSLPLTRKGWGGGVQTAIQKLRRVVSWSPALHLWASASPGLALWCPGRPDPGPCRGSSPCSAASGFPCCCQGWGVHSPRPILKERRSIKRGHVTFPFVAPLITPSQTSYLVCDVEICFTFVLMRIKPGPAQRTKARDIITP